MRGAEVFCVLGMHRSGTSLLTGLLNRLGVNLGSERHLMPADEYNSRGYWEHSGITSLNEEILGRLGGTWDEPPPFPPGWERAAAMDDLKQRARRMIQDSFTDARTWGWKDPRSCLTLPFWQQLLPDMRYLVCLRNPVDVALSLERPHHFSAQKSSRLWFAYSSSALTHSVGRSRLIVFHEDLMADCIGELQRMASFIGRPGRVKQADVQETARAFVARDLQHYRTSLVKAMLDSRIDRRARALYGAQRIRAYFGR